MIRFSLHCDDGHEFEAWFRGNADYEAQVARGLVACPSCGSAKVGKSLMAPAVATGRSREKVALAVSPEQKKAMAQLRKLAAKMRENADYVGDKFADEARKIHFGETEARGIYGEATGEEVKGLLDDGVDFMPIPDLPDDKN